MHILDFVAEQIFGICIPLLLFSGGIYFTIRLKAFPFLYPKKTASYMLKPDHLPTKNGTTPFRALCMALGGTLGVGNIVGVALAIRFGGAGSLFWMWVSGVFAMLLKYAEILLSLQGKKRSEGKQVAIPSLLYIYPQNRHKKPIGLWIFGGACTLVSIPLGGMIQANAVSEVFESTLCFSPIVMGVVLFMLTIVVILGGGKRISDVTFRLIPLASLGYVVLTLGVIFAHAERIPFMLKDIFVSAFSSRSVVSGVGCFAWHKAIRIGCARGLISNEAGCGTAPMAHATSSTTSAARQGLLGVFEVLIDTLLLCSLTGFSILLVADKISIHEGGGLSVVLSALSTVWGKWAGVLLAVCVLLFAFATIVCWFYYGSVGLSVFSKKPHSKTVYAILFSGAVCVGAVSAPLFLWSVCDILLGIMTAVNLVALFRHRKTIIQETEALPFLVKPSAPSRDKHT